MTAPRETTTLTTTLLAVWVIASEAVRAALSTPRMMGMATTQTTTAAAQTEQLERAFDAPDTMRAAKMASLREMYLDAVERGEIEPDDADHSYEAALDAYHGFYR